MMGSKKERTLNQVQGRFCSSSKLYQESELKSRFHSRPDVSILN
jgi:hypothetical protein